MICCQKIILQVAVPSVECILGDKLTAFAPHTIGVRFRDDYYE